MTKVWRVPESFLASEKDRTYQTVQWASSRGKNIITQKLNVEEIQRRAGWLDGWIFLPIATYPTLRFYNFTKLGFFTC